MAPGGKTQLPRFYLLARLLQRTDWGKQAWTGAEKIHDSANQTSVARKIPILHSKAALSAVQHKVPDDTQALHSAGQRW